MWYVGSGVPCITLGFICVGTCAVGRSDNAEKRSNEAQERFVRTDHSVVSQPCLSSFLQTCHVSLGTFRKLDPDPKYIMVDEALQCFWPARSAGKLMIWLSSLFLSSCHAVCLWSVEMCAETWAQHSGPPSLAVPRSQQASCRWSREREIVELWVTCLFYMGRHFPVSQWEKTQHWSFCKVTASRQV